jgi:lysophospholipase L1-like esterase
MKTYPNSPCLALRAALAALLSIVLVARAQPPVAAPASTNAPAAQTAPAIPTIFIAGDSTAKNNANGALGWGTPFASYFDPAKVQVANRAHAGTSSRTYMNGDWPNVLPDIKPGDYVLVVFGINDGGPPNTVRDRGSIPGIGDDTKDLTRDDGSIETAHTYGWYMAKFATDARAKGAHVYFLTVTARDIWTNPKAKFRDATIISQDDGYDTAQDKIERGTANGKYTAWTVQVGKNLGVPVLDLTNLLADTYEKMGRENVMVNFVDHNHTKPAGAEIVAASVVAGLKAFKGSPFLALLSDKGHAVAAADPKYVAENSVPAAAAADVAAAPSATPTAANVPVPLVGQAPNAVPANPNLPTLWLIGDSTVRNGSLGDGSNMNQWGWGAPLEYYFDQSKINVVNRALGGTSSRSFYNVQWKRVVPLLKSGDFVIMQFGANDNNGNLTGPSAGRASLNGVGDDTQPYTDARSGQPETVHTYGWYLKQYIAEARAQGVTPIVCSLTPRKIWDDDGRIHRDAANYAGWAKDGAASTNAPFVDLNEISARKFDALGKEQSDLRFVPSPTEHTHTDWYGAVINAESVVGGLKALSGDPLAAYFSARGAAVPAVDLSQPEASPPAPAATAAAPTK